MYFKDFDKLNNVKKLIHADERKVRISDKRLKQVKTEIKKFFTLD